LALAEGFLIIHFKASVNSTYFQSNKSHFYKTGKVLLSLKFWEMKTKSLLQFAFCLFMMSKMGLAQPATIYYLGIEVDPILVQFNKVEDKSRNWLNSVATSEIFPGYLIDSIQEQTVKLVSQFSKLQASMCPYPISTKLIQGYALNPPLAPVCNWCQPKVKKHFLSFKRYHPKS